MTRRGWVTGMLMAPLVAAAAPAPAAAPPPRPAMADLWLNPGRSVAVHTGTCGDRICGWIVWASAGALPDARDAGVDHLVGTALLQDYRPACAYRWKGTVFVPDMDRRFASEIDAIGPGTLKIKGCMLAGLVCKSQVWTRIAGLPA